MDAACETVEWMCKRKTPTGLADPVGEEERERA